MHLYTQDLYKTVWKVITMLLTYFKLILYTQRSIIFILVYLAPVLQQLLQRHEPLMNRNLLLMTRLSVWEALQDDAWTYANCTTLVVDLCTKEVITYTV